MIVKNQLLKIYALSETEIEHHKLCGLFKERFPQQFKAQWLHNKILHDELSTWPSSHPSQGIILKGPHLLEDYYQEFGERFMGDIDLLVSQDEFENWAQFLIKQGFSPYKTSTWEGNDFKSLFRKTLANQIDIIVELHSRLFYQQERSLTPYSQPSRTLYPFYKLEKEELFIHLCGHLAYQHNFISLHWLFDIVLLIDQDGPELDWIRVKILAAQYKVERSCKIICHLLNRDFQLPLPNVFKDLSLQDRLLLSLITPRFLSSQQRKPLRYWPIKHLIKDTLMDALIYDINWSKAKL